ncbi:SDR family oxidoreductase [Singulisphaera acidiphila]|uniref:Short-chain alcohol dehydrogenase n=1 Tax=Singulisphaera acidiphila (strain ATCC BAA-1392 / DSM 18658 / VKM B-2454 / MOB10) TaxID=886293 RepID=L0DGE6_SINAD|nr:SDR family oxidoreductase [Singulisphaera acidiphila]AGA28352.1 short-chain alcohol dehydrogenase [Singulisphaera acidiphila DSM 18658]
MSGIQQKVVVITGASSGIGEATAMHLARHGARVVVGARRTDRLEKLVSAIRAGGGTAEYQAVDVTKREQVEALVRLAKAKFGRVDVVVNNAGIMPLSPLEALKVDEWDRMIDVNIKGLLYGIAAGMPVFKEQKAGHFVNVSSIGGHFVVPTAAVYCATKFAVRAISDGLRQESRDVRVTIISPGVVESELADTITDEGAKKAMDEFRANAIPPEAIARAILFAIEQPADVSVSEIIVRPTGGA